MGNAAPPVDVVRDPHVQNAILCLTLAVVAAVIAWALGLPDKPR
jgi:hypothetical protein